MVDCRTGEFNGGEELQEELESSSTALTPSFPTWTKYSQSNESTDKCLIMDSKDMLPRKDAPIIPGKSLGGLLLGSKIEDLDIQIVSYFNRHVRKQSWYRLVFPFEARYTLDFVELCVDVRSGTIFKLTAIDGYDGSLPPGITIGMTVGEAMEHDDRIYYDEGAKVVKLRNVPGILIDIEDDDDPPVDIVPTLKIVAISVTTSDEAEQDSYLSFHEGVMRS